MHRCWFKRTTISKLEFISLDSMFHVKIQSINYIETMFDTFYGLFATGQVARQSKRGNDQIKKRKKNHPIQIRSTAWHVQRFFFLAISIDQRFRKESLSSIFTKSFTLTAPLHNNNKKQTSQSNRSIIRAKTKKKIKNYVSLI